MKRNLTHVILLFFSVFVVHAFVYAERFGDLIYEELSDSIRIIGHSELAEGELVLPAMINGKPVTVIGEGAFEGSRLDAIVLPDSVLEIEANVFNGSLLKEIHISGSVQTISESALKFCNNLEWIEVDASNPNFASVDGVLFNKTISELLRVPWSKSAIEGYTVPETVTSIAGSAFHRTGIAQVTVPSGLVSIGDSAFWGSALTSLSIPASTTVIGNEAFSDCRSLASFDVDPANSSFSSQDGVLFDKGMETLLIYPQSLEGESYSVPDGVLRIEDFAFQSSIFLMNLSFPATLSEIGVKAFDYLWSSSFDVAAENSHFQVVDGVLFTFDGSELVAYPRRKDASSYTVPDGTEIIRPYAFLQCSDLVTVTLPEGLRILGDHAFDLCQQLQTINLPDSVTRLGDRTFSRCGQLNDVIIPSGISYIGVGVFERCSSFKSMVVPDGITEIKESTFEGCRLMESITLPDSIEVIAARAFLGCRFLKEINLPAGVRTIGEAAFSTCQDLTSITIPEGVETIPAAAFEFCFELLSIELPSTLTSIEAEAFRLCQNLPELTIPAAVETIGSFAFDECRELTAINVADANVHFRSVGGVLFSHDMSRLIRVPTKLPGATYQVPSQVQHLDPMSFQKCEFTSVQLPVGLQFIGELAFEQCPFLESIDIPDTVLEIGDEVFFGCANLKSVVLSSGMQSIPDGMFRRCSTLLNVEIPQSVRRIEDRAFNDCTELPGIQLPENLEYLGNHAFDQCSQLLSISIPSSVRQIGDNAFRECNHLLEVRFNEGLEVIGDFAFDGCNFLERIEFPQSLRRIEDRAFTDCAGIREFQFSQGLEFIGEFAFLNCWRFEVARLPESLMNIEIEAFNGCISLKYIYFFGDAPTVGEPTPFKSIHNEAAVYYFEGASGFTSPDWAGLPTVNLGAPKKSDLWLIDNLLPHETDLGIVSSNTGLPILINYSWDQMLGNISVPQAQVEGDAIIYTFFGGRSDVTYIVEISKDLNEWTSTGVTLSEPDSEGLRTASFNLNEGRCFVRSRFIQL